MQAARGQGHYDDRSLLQHGITEESTLSLVFKTRDVKLFLKGQRPKTLSNVKQGTNYAAFLALARACLHCDLPCGTRFTCQCGRVLANESVERQQFPLKCCLAAVPRFTVRIPREQAVRSNTLTSRFLAPQSDLLTRTLDSVKALSSCKTERQRQEAEADVVRGCLELGEARAINIELDQRLDLRVELADKKPTWWSVWPAQAMSEVAKDIERKAGKPVRDLVVQRNRFLKVRENEKKTFAEANIRNGQTVKVVFMQLKSESGMREGCSSNIRPLTVKFRLCVRKAGLPVIEMSLKSRSIVRLFEKDLESEFETY